MQMIVQKKLGVGAGVTSCARSSRPGHVARFVCSASGSSEAQSARHVPLPTGAMWLLDTFQDNFYDIRGQSFVVKRAEQEAESAFKRVRKTGPLQRMKQREEETLGMIHKVVWQHPGAAMLLEGPTLDVTDWVLDEEELQQEVEVEVQAPITPNTTCTGIVMVPQAEPSEQEVEEEGAQEVYYTNSTSPRRTKRIGFTCKCCGARTFSAINPQSYLGGTLVVQCAKCEVWHKISDHLGLFHELEGPLFPSASTRRLSPEDIPESLRPLDPFYWAGGAASSGGAAADGKELGDGPQGWGHSDLN